MCHYIKKYMSFCGLFFFLSIIAHLGKCQLYCSICACMHYLVVFLIILSSAPMRLLDKNNLPWAYACNFNWSFLCHICKCVSLCGLSCPTCAFKCHLWSFCATCTCKQLVHAYCILGVGALLAHNDFCRLMIITGKLI